ncbi:MAG: MFS transporter [Chloroflexi bacterium]|nr:MFS transporter [Chloroflexota bacterium]
MALFRALQHRPFALLWSGQTISSLGDSVYRIALAWWVLEETGSATAMGVVLIFIFAPMLLFFLLGGVAVDRFPRARLMLVSDFLRGVVVGAIGLLVMADALDLGHIYLASIVFGLVDAVFQPAYTALVPEITPRESLPSANSLTTLSHQLAGIGGPALGATLVGAGGTGVAFAADGLSFFISGACLLPLTGLSVANLSGPGRRGVLKDLREGFDTVFGSAWLWITIALFALVNVTQGGPFHVALPFLVKDHLKADVGTLGLLYSTFSLGFVLGAVWLGRLTRIPRRGLLAYSSTVTSGLMTLALGLPIPILGIFLAAFVRGVAYSAFGLIWTNTLQELVPRERLGRVSSIDYLGSFVLLPIGYGIAGVATDVAGPALVFVIGGALTVGLALLGLAHPSIRNLD